MSRKLTPNSSLENLKREAKRWLKAVREGDRELRARIERSVPDLPAEPRLRDVQRALAVEHGFPTWAALRRQLTEDPPGDDDAHAKRVARFLETACPDFRTYGASGHAMARNTAERLLARHPEIARENLSTAVVCGEIEEVQRILTENPATANEPGGPRNWPPLLSLCHTRLSRPGAANDHAIAIAIALLDHGADPNARYFAGGGKIPYSCLTGLVGEGEGDAPPHPHRNALADLLLERGAEPYDIQVLYNTHFRGDILWLIERIYAHAIRRGRRADWADPEWQMLGMGGYGCGARYLLTVAMSRENLALAEWLLQHGASPNAPPPPGSPRWKPPQISLHEEALRRGQGAMADLLVRYGATPSGYVPEGVEAFAAACRRLDREGARAMRAQHPEYLRNTEIVFVPIRHDRADVVALLLDLGVPIELEDENKCRPLHVAAGHDALDVARLLIERGAEIDPVETGWGNTPLDFAVYEGHQRMIELLSPISRDIWNITFTGNLERLRELLDADPSLARAVRNNGETLLMWLPDDEAKAIAIAEFLLEQGADATHRDANGMTARDHALRRGLEDVARLLE
jgi:uncharacterized protein